MLAISFLTERGENMTNVPGRQNGHIGDFPAHMSVLPGKRARSGVS